MPLNVSDVQYWSNTLTGCVGWVLKITVRTALHWALHKTGWFIHILGGAWEKNIRGWVILGVVLRCRQTKYNKSCEKDTPDVSWLHICWYISRALCLSTHNPQAIHRNFRMKLSDAVLPPAPGLWVGEVGEGSRARPNLDTKYGYVHHTHTHTSQWERKAYIPRRKINRSLTFPIRMCPVAFLMKTSRFSPSSKGEYVPGGLLLLIPGSWDTNQEAKTQLPGRTGLLPSTGETSESSIITCTYLENYTIFKKYINNWCLCFKC